MALSSLSMQGVSKSFGRHAVLRGLDLDVAPGSFCSVLGPSGSGKTTLLRILAGFEQPDAGQVVLNGEVLEDGRRTVPPNRRRIGYVPQDGSLFPHLSVRQNVAFGLPRRERRGKGVADLLAMVGLEGLERRYPHQLSGGQQQRVALARALAVGPALVLLDEPFSSLDASLRASVRQDVRRALADEGATVLLVTHDQDEALSLSDQVAVIQDGRLGQCGPPGALYRRPVSPALARSLGQANFVTGTATGGTVSTPLGVLPLEGPGYRGGTELLVLIRPEQVELLPAGTQARCVGEVTGREYYGHDAVVWVRADGAEQSTLMVRVTSNDTIPECGARVGLSVRGGVVAWPAEAGARAPGSDG